MVSSPREVVVVILDTENLDWGQHELTEVGMTVVTTGELLDKAASLETLTEHYIVEETRDKKNVRFPQHRDSFRRGTSKVMRLEDIKFDLKHQLNMLSRSRPLMFLAGHSIQGDLIEIETLLENTVDFDGLF